MYYLLNDIFRDNTSNTSGPFGSSLLNIAKAAQLQRESTGTNSVISKDSFEVEDIESIDQSQDSIDIKPDPDDGLDPIERIAANTGTLQTLQKMRTGEFF